MGVVKLQCVIRCSSQDPAHIADNLLDVSRCLPWLSDPMLRSGHLEAEFKLDSTTHIDFIDIGNYGSSTIELQVGKYSSNQSTAYVSLLPAVALLTFADIKAGADLRSIYMFDKTHLNSVYVEETWDCVKVICSQPYKKQMQFGLSFLSLRSKESSSRLIIDDNCNIDKSYDRFPKCLRGNSPLDAKALMTRGKRILNASKSQISASRKKSTGQINSFKTDATNFFIACTLDVKRRNKPVEDYLKEFEQQRQKTLSLLEKKIFCDRFKDIFNNNTEGNKLSLTDENNPNDLGNPSLFSTPENCVEEFNSFTFNEKVPPNPRKRTASSSMAADKVAKFSIICETEEKPLYSASLQDNRKGKKGNIFAKFFKNKSSTSASFQDVKKQKKQQEDSKIKPTQTKIGFTRPEDFIQPDGIQPSTSSGITFVDCPVCRESFMSSEIEQHASTCGEPPKVSSNKNVFESDPVVVHLSDEYLECPLCKKNFHADVIAFHVEECLNMS